MISDEQGSIIAHYYYTPYGELLESHSIGLGISPYKFASHEKDEPGDIYYFNSRYYNTDTGRFTSPDSIIDGVYTTQGHNRYMYAKGNPVRLTDRTGNYAGDYFEIDITENPGVINVGTGDSSGGSSGGNGGGSSNGGAPQNNLDPHQWYPYPIYPTSTKHYKKKVRIRKSDNSYTEVGIHIGYDTPTYGMDQAAKYGELLPPNYGKEKNYYIDPKIGSHPEFYNNSSYIKVYFDSFISIPFSNFTKYTKSTPAIIGALIGAGVNGVNWAIGHGDKVTFVTSTIQDAGIAFLGVKLSTYLIAGLKILVTLGYLSPLLAGPIGIIFTIGILLYINSILSPLREENIDPFIRKKIH